MVSLDNPSAKPNAWFKLDRDVLTLGGTWTIGESARLDPELRRFNPQAGGAIAIDASGIERLDSAGAWLMLRTRRALEEAGHCVSSKQLGQLKA